MCKHGRVKVIAAVDVRRSEAKSQPLTQITDINSIDDDILPICRFGCAAVGTARPASRT